MARDKGNGREMAARSGARRLRAVSASARALVLGAMLSLAGTGGAPGQSGDLPRLSAMARLGSDGVQLTRTEGTLTLELPLSQAVPWRARLVSQPPRLVLDLDTLDWAGTDAAALTGASVRAARVGRLESGWARLVLDLGGPHVIDHAGMSTDPDSGAAHISVSLRRSTLEELAATAWSDADIIATAGGGLLHPQAPAPDSRRSRTVVVLDPGHGGFDPGAERDGLREADLMLQFAFELRAALQAAGGFDVVLTREEDVFVSLDARIRTARAAGADVFLSLHADALPEGSASGATLYSLAEEASDKATAYLAERHDRADLLAGVDLRRAEDAIANVLMSIARTETRPRTDLLGDKLIDALRDADLRLHSRPRQSGAFSVLRAPDIPALLLELGFMSNPRDLAQLIDPDWRARMAAALTRGIRAWADADTVHRTLLRQ